MCDGQPVPEHHISSGWLMVWVGNITAISYSCKTERSVWMCRKGHLGDSALREPEKTAQEE